MKVSRNTYLGIAGLLLACWLVAALTPPSLQAQVLYGSVVGIIQDPTGAVVPNATVTLTSKATGLSRETTTDQEGRYSFVNVLPGTYQIRVTATGFRPLTRENVEVSVSAVTRVDLQLEVGPLAEEVTVAAEAIQLQTDKSEVRHEITTVALTQLPLPYYRNYQSLLDLLPGTTPSAFQNAIVDTPARALTTRVNGTPRNMNTTVTDGAANIFVWLPHHTAYVQPVESIEAVNISTNAFDAEQGLAGGAAITVVTKSGTNELRGSAFWFHNNQHWLAEPYFRPRGFRKPKDIFNQFGGTIGGPVKRDRLFYFFSFEGTYYRQGGSGNWSVPPETFRRGDFSTWPGCTVCGAAFSVVYDPATMVGNDPRTRQPFPGNRVPESRIHPIFNEIQKRIPLPNQVSPIDPQNNLSGNFFASGTLKFNRRNYDFKMNWHPNAKIVVWGKLSRMGAPVSGKHIFGEMVGPNIGTAGVGDVRVNMPSFGITYTVSPTFLFDAVFGYQRHDQDVLGIGQGKNWGLDVFKIPGTNGGRQYANDMRYSGVPCFSTGFSTWGLCETWLPLERRERTYTAPVNFTKIHGAHEFRWGFEPRRLEMNHWQPETANPRGAITFGTGPTIIPGQPGRVLNSYATALLGLVTSYSKSIQFFLMKTREWQYAWYFRDRWQVTRRLTLNLGLRYEYFPLLNRGDRGIERWDPYTNIVYLGGIGNVPWNAGIEVSKKLFAPRVGFAYRVGENWVVRSGYGITYDPLPFGRPLRGLYPATLTGTWDAGTQGAEFRDSTYGWFNTLEKGIPDVPTPDISKGTLELPLNLDMGPRSPWGGMLHRGYIQSWNFIVERRLPFSTVVSAGYVATRTIHQMLDRNINTVGPGLGGDTRNLPLAKLYGRTNAANMWDGIGYGTYNSLQVTINKAFSHGLFLKGAYTWGRYMNMAEDNGWAGFALWHWEPMIPRNYAPSSEDRRHSFSIGWVYEIPVGAGRALPLSGIWDKVLGGWKINGMFFAYSGTPFTVTGSWSSLLCIGCTQTADQVGPLRKLGGKGPGQPYYDPMSFRDPLFTFDPKNPVYRPGTMGRNAVYGPGFWRIDPAVYKEFAVTERVRMEVRLEARNGTNTPRWGNPNSGAASMQLNPDGSLKALNNFMCITSASAERQFRMGIRFQF